MFSPLTFRELARLSVSVSPVLEERDSSNSSLWDPALCALEISLHSSLRGLALCALRTSGSSLSPYPVLRTLAPAAGHTDLIGFVCVPLGSLPGSAFV